MAKSRGKVRFLEVGLKTNFKQFETRMKSLKKKLKSFAGDVAKVGKAFAAMGAASGAALTALTVKSMSSIDKLAKLSDRLQMGTDQLRVYQQAVVLSGGSQEKFTDSIQEMTKRLGEAQLGTGESIVGLKALNIELKDIIDLPVAQQFEMIADAIKATADPKNQMLAADKLFGGSGKDLLNVLQKGSAGLNKYRDELQKLGVLYDRGMAAKVEAANDSITRSMGIFEGLGNRLAVKVAPIIEVVSDKIRNLAIDGDWMGEKFNNAFRWVEDVLINATDSLNMFKAGWHALATGINYGLAGIQGTYNWFESRFEKMKLYLKMAGIAWTEMKEKALRSIGEILAKLQPAVNVIKHLIETLSGNKIKIGNQFDLGGKAMIESNRPSLLTLLNRGDDYMGYEAKIKDINKKGLLDHITSSTFGIAGGRSKNAMGNAWDAFTGRDISSKVRTWYDGVKEKSKELSANVMNRVSGWSGLPGTSGLPGSNSFNEKTAIAAQMAAGGSSTYRAGTFRQIDLANMSVKGLAMQSEQKVRDPQLKETNTILKQLLNKPMVAVAG